MLRVRLTVAYDGAGFHGFWPNAGVRTVGGVLAEALATVTGAPIELTCAGRTDAGVHAWGQVVSLDLPAEGLEPAEVQHRANRLLGPEVVVRAAEEAPAGFDARFDATSRTYRYTVLNREVPDPFLAATSWYVPQPLDLRLLRAAADPLIGEHDFSSFCRRPKASSRSRSPRPGDGSEVSLVRRVLDAGWTDLGEGVLRFEITASAFCHQMVRSVTALLVECGRARRTPAEVMALLRARDRAGAPSPAPPHGLCLWSVAY